MTDSGTACASLCLLFCYTLCTSSRPTNQCRTILSAPILLPQPVSSSHVGACLSTLRWSFFAAQVGLAPATLCPSTLHTHAVLPISSADHPGSLHEHFVHVLRADHSHVQRHLHLKHQGVPLWPLGAQITGFHTSLLLQALSPVSMSALQKSASSTPSDALFSHLPIQTFRAEERCQWTCPLQTPNC